MTTWQRADRRLGTRILTIVAVVMLLAGIAVVLPPDPVAAAPSGPAAQEQQLFSLMNQERAAAGLPALVYHASLAATARTWSSTMASGGFRHDPNLGAKVLRVEPNATAWAENIGWNSSGSIPGLHNVFMASAAHRANVMSGGFNRVGVGIVTSGGRTYATVRFFAGPSLGCSAQPMISVVAADLDGDDADDITINRSGRNCDRVLVASGSSAKFSPRPVVVGGTYTPVAGNFDGGGNDEVFWYAPGTATDYLSKWSGSAFNSIPQAVNGNYRPYTGDLDGDGRDDILWYAPGTTQDYIWYGTSTFGSFDSRPLTVNGRYDVVITDLDGDSRDDVLWYGPGTAPDYVHYSTRRGGYTSVAVTVNGRYRPVAGDFDGDDRGDVMWYAPGSSQDYVWYGHGRRGSYDSRAVTVQGTYKVVTGNFDGDDRTDIAWLGSEPAGSPLWFGRSSRGSFGQSNIGF